MKAVRAFSIRIIAAGAGLALFATSGHAQDKNRPATAADLARLENEIREQRSVILHMLKVEQERSEVMLKLLEGRCGSSLDGTRPAPAAGSESIGSGRGIPSSAVPGGPGEAAQAGTPAVATVKGRVQGTGGELQNVHVYLEGLRSSGKGKTVEIVQKNKQFSPQFSVAIAGTTATFPNRDVMFHNVFSPSPKRFDIGTRQAGDQGPSVDLDTPGVVDIYCNIHSKMTAKILVVPNRVYTKVAADGTFRLDKVPLGKRKLVAWGPGWKAQRHDVEVTATGADVRFDLEAEPAKAHPNKAGLPYGSYKE